MRRPPPLAVLFTDAELDVIRSHLSVSLDSGEEDGHHRCAAMERVIAKIDRARDEYTRKRKDP